MKQEYEHLSDESLLLLADGEMTSYRAAEANAHLAACWDCRGRLHQLEDMIADFVDIHHRVLDPRLPPAAGPRALLKARLAQPEVADPPASWLQQFRRSFAIGRLGYIGAMAVLLVGGTVVAHRLLLSGTPTSKRSYWTARPEPDRHLTPGVVRAVSTTEVCKARYSDDTHMVPAAVRERVFREYGVAKQQSKDYELDYLISPQLGGADDILNLWPEPEAVPDWNMRAKDELEDRLHEMVCDGTIDLPTAQRDLSTDWIGAYKRYFRTDKPGVPL